MQLRLHRLALLTWMLQTVDEWNQRITRGIIITPYICKSIHKRLPLETFVDMYLD